MSDILTYLFNRLWKLKLSSVAPLTIAFHFAEFFGLSFPFNIECFPIWWSGFPFKIYGVCQKKTRNLVCYLPFSIFVDFYEHRLSKWRDIPCLRLFNFLRFSAIPNNKVTFQKVKVCSASWRFYQVWIERTHFMDEHPVWWNHMIILEVTIIDIQLEGKRY